jgi:DNA-binding CsgD family transcriptional regulator
MTVTCAGVEQLLGRHEEARRRLERALQRLGDANDPEAAALMIQLALDASYRPSSEGWQHWITRALALIEPLDDAPLRALGFSVAALLCAFATEVAEADEYRSRAVAVVDQLDDEEQATCLEALVHLAGAEVYLEHFEPAIGHGQRALVLSRATGQGGLLPILAPALSLALWTRGQLADAVDVLDGAIESGRLVRDRQALAWHLLNRGFTAATAGDVDVALRACRESFELGQELDGSFIAMWASICLAAAHLENDDPAEALELFDISGAGEVLELVPGFWRAMWLDILSRCQIGAGDAAGARRSAAAAEDVASSTPMLRMAGAWAARAAARVALADGDAQSAAASALRSADIFDDVGAPIEAGLARALAGAALAGTGDRVRAIDELTRAAGAFDGCGAIRYRQSAERELRKLGQHVQRTPRGRGVGDGLASLTDREMEVARLVVERKTNPEIAGELFLSQKTVETHLRNIFHKLEVSSRVEVARAVERARAADPG